MWTTVQIVLGLLGILLVLGGDKLSIPALGHAGIAFLGLTSMAIGWEAIFTRQIQLGRRRHGNVQTYTGLAAILHGIQFNLLGLFLIGIAVMTYFNANGRAVFSGCFYSCRQLLRLQARANLARDRAGS
jgi:uncharacterized membrane protein